MSDKDEVFEVINIFTFGVNMNCENYNSLIFGESSKKSVNADKINVGYDYVKIQDDVYQVNLNFNASYVNDDGEEVLGFGIIQSGVFQIAAGSNSDENFLEIAINVNCPSILMPYIRPIYNMLISQNGIKPRPIGTVDFYANYMSAKNDSLLEKTDESQDSLEIEDD